MKWFLELSMELRRATPQALVQCLQKPSLPICNDMLQMLNDRNDVRCDAMVGLPAFVQQTTAQCAVPELPCGLSLLNVELTPLCLAFGFRHRWHRPSLPQVRHCVETQRWATEKGKVQRWAQPQRLRWPSAWPAR